MGSAEGPVKELSRVGPRTQSHQGPTPGSGTFTPPSSVGAAVVSPLLWGTNYWREDWPDDVVMRALELNLKLVRWGGLERDLTPKTARQVDRFISLARNCRAEPLIQARLLRSAPEEAAALVRYVNVEQGYGVKYWAIGNEPDLWDRFHWGGVSWGPYPIDRFNRDWRAFFSAMKEVDPSIVIVGPDLASKFHLDDPAHDWLTPFLLANGDVVEAVSLHWYPFKGDEHCPEVLLREPGRFEAWIGQINGHVRMVTGREIPLAVTETNLTWDWNATGEGSGASIYAGVRLADVLGISARHRLFMLNTWCMFSDAGLSMLGSSADQMRPTYYAMLAYAAFGGSLVTAMSGRAGVSIYASRDTREGRVAVVLVNRSEHAEELDLLLRLPGETDQLALDLASPLRYHVHLPAYAFAWLALDCTLHFAKGKMYSKQSFDNSAPPETFALTARRPL